jgi:hypothetical protein
MKTVSEKLSVTVLGKFNYALSPVSTSIENVANLSLYRESEQLLRTKSQGAILVSVVDTEDHTCDVANNLFHYEETIMMDVTGSDEEEALNQANMQVNEMTLKDEYITLVDLSGNPHCFHIIQNRIEWVESEIA